MRALIVDDSKATRSVIAKILRGLGFEVSQAEDGKQALLKIEACLPPDIALVDWNMPEMNGLELILALRNQSKFDTVKLIMVTTESEIDQIQKALDAGADEYLMKPFTPDALGDKLGILGFSPA